MVPRSSESRFGGVARYSHQGAEFRVITITSSSTITTVTRRRESMRSQVIGACGRINMGTLAVCGSSSLALRVDGICMVSLPSPNSLSSASALSHAYFRSRRVAHFRKSVIISPALNSSQYNWKIALGWSSALRGFWFHCDLCRDAGVA